MNRHQPTKIVNRPARWVLFFTLLGFSLRVQQLNLQPLWGDEGWSIYFVVQPLGQLLALTAADIHPPLYYLLLKAWLALTGLGPETARLFSVAAGTLLIPTTAALGRQLLGRRAAPLAAAVTALAPPAVYYAQEVRMYGLVTLLGVLSSYFLSRWAMTPRRRFLWGYVLTAAAALYTMYYAAFLLLAHLAFLLYSHPSPAEPDFDNKHENGETPPTPPGLRRHSHRSNTQHATRNTPLLHLLPPFIAIGLLYLPWVIYAGPKLLDYISNKREVEGYAALGPLRFAWEHLAAFGLGHLPPELAALPWLALPALLAVALGLWAIRHRHRAVLLPFTLFGPLLAGFLVNLLFPFTPRFFERTLLLAAPAFWLLLAAGLGWLWQRQRIAAGLLAGAALAPALVGLFTFFTLPRTPAEDYRPLLRQIAARATPADTLLASYQWQLGFYHAYLPAPLPRIFSVPGWGQGWSADAGNAGQLTADLTAIFAQSPRLWFPAYQAGGHIWEDEAEAAIARLGYPALLRWYGPQTKLTLAGAPQQPEQAIPPANFDDALNLTAATVGGEAFQAGRDVIPVTLNWQKTGDAPGEYLVSLRLADAAGRTWASRDSHPQAGQTRFSQLSTGDTLTDPHGLLTPAGAPPGRYRLLLSLRRVGDALPLDLLDAAGQPQGVELPLGDIELVEPAPPLGADALPAQIRTDADFGGQVQLVGYSLPAGPFTVGDALPLTLYWAGIAAPPDDFEVAVELQDAAGQVALTVVQPPARPAANWPPGALLTDPHDIALPPTLPPGDYRLTVALASPGGQRWPVAGADRLPLQGISVIDRTRNFEAPTPQIALDANFGDVARLAGIDLPQQSVAPGGTLPLSLHWQALATADRNWKVFVHLTDAQGQLIAQQDQLPGGGRFPTGGWLPEEYLLDEYALPIPPDAPPGSYRLSLGLYDPNDFTRLPLLENGQIAGDQLTLESWLISVE